LIYKHQAKLYAYQKTEIDQILGRLMKKVETAYEREIDFSNHTLRRTSGRMLWKAKVPLEVIKEILGHQDPVQTIRYLGLNLDDQDEAMSKLAQYQNSLAPEPDEWWTDRDFCPRNLSGLMFKMP
jgi:integrase